MTVAIKETYLEACLTGAFSAEEVNGQIDAVVQQCVDEGRAKVLLNFTNLTGDPSTIDRYVIGVHVARYARYSIKFSALTLPEHIDPNRFGETVAVNRGARARVFADRAKAIRWLVAP